VKPLSFYGEERKIVDVIVDEEMKDEVKEVQ